MRLPWHSWGHFFFTPKKQKKKKKLLEENPSYKNPLTGSTSGGCLKVKENGTTESATMAGQAFYLVLLEVQHVVKDLVEVVADRLDLELLAEQVLLNLVDPGRNFCKRTSISQTAKPSYAQFFVYVRYSANLLMFSYIEIYVLVLNSNFNIYNYPLSWTRISTIHINLAVYLL